MHVGEQKDECWRETAAHLSNIILAPIDQSVWVTAPATDKDGLEHCFLTSTPADMTVVRLNESTMAWSKGVQVVEEWAWPGPASRNLPGPSAGGGRMF